MKAERIEQLRKDLIQIKPTKFIYPGYAIVLDYRGKWTVEENTTGPFYRTVSEWDTFEEALEDLSGMVCLLFKKR